MITILTKRPDGNRKRREPVSEFAIRVHIFRAGCFCGTEVFNRGELRIGRDPRTELPLMCETVSGAHAVVGVLGNRLVIEDSGSKNGVKVNGRKTLKKVVGVSDEVSIGTFVLHFQLVGYPNAESDRERTQPAAILDDIIAEAAPACPPLAGQGAGPGSVGDSIAALVFGYEDTVEEDTQIQTRPDPLKCMFPPADSIELEPPTLCRRPPSREEEDDFYETTVVTNAA